MKQFSVLLFLAGFCHGIDVNPDSTIEVVDSTTLEIPVECPVRIPPTPSWSPGALNTSLVACETTKGPLNIAVHHGWAPRGAKRFLELVDAKFFESHVALFRVVPNWIVQFGISGDPEVTAHWASEPRLEDDPGWLPPGPRRFKRGLISFAGGGPNSRGTELFVANADNPLGDAPHEVPFGHLVGAQSFRTMDAWYAGYGEIAAFGGNAPNQGEMYQRGLEYLREGFPDLDYITKCELSWQSTWTAPPDSLKSNPKKKKKTTSKTTNSDPKASADARGQEL